MTEEEINALLAENKRLHIEVGALQQQVGQLIDKLQAAMARIAELEQRKKKPPPY